MGEDPASTKWTWVIKDVSLGSTYTFQGGAFQWGLRMATSLLFKLQVEDRATLPPGWRKDIRFKIVIVNQIDKNRSITKEGDHIFDARSRFLSWRCLIQKSYVCDANGFIVNDSLVLEVEIVSCKDQNNLSQDIEKAKTPKRGTQNLAVKVNEELVEESTSSKKARLHKVLIENPQIKSDDPIVNVYGFNVRASEQEIMTLMFKKHPDVFSDFHFQNHRLRSKFMDELLKVINILCMSHLITQKDTDFTVTSLTDFKKAGLKVEWLDTKWKDVSERKIKISRIRSVELRKQIEEMKLEVEETMKKIKNAEALLEKEEEEEEVEAAKIRLTLNDVM